MRYEDEDAYVYPQDSIGKHAEQEFRKSLADAILYLFACQSLISIAWTEQIADFIFVNVNVHVDIPRYANIMRDSKA